MKEERERGLTEHESVFRQESDQSEESVFTQESVFRQEY